ncbi:hypothetical protein [Oceanospirillum multiglobuliferum]|uniref:hypothetical protein n=1 Tax=Oceanospirillum multiglobuliferum TaxID=64969 RepID=UPI001F2D7789|nr:hypothetical protein [Oceanospirillum multiglobuliferum]
MSIPLNSPWVAILNGSHALNATRSTLPIGLFCVAIARLSLLALDAIEHSQSNNIRADFFIPIG